MRRRNEGFSCGAPKFNHSNLIKALIRIFDTALAFGDNVCCIVGKAYG